MCRISGYVLYLDLILSGGLVYIVYNVQSAGRPLVRLKRHNVITLSAYLTCIWTEWCVPGPYYFDQTFNPQIKIQFSNGAKFHHTSPPTQNSQLAPLSSNITICPPIEPLKLNILFANPHSGAVDTYN